MPELLAPQLHWQGEDCLALHWPSVIDPALNRQVHRLRDALRDAKLPALIDLVPAYASLALYFDAADPLDRAAIRAQVESAISDLSHGAKSAEIAPIEVPVCYHAALAPDLEAAARHLGIDAEDLTRRHAEPVYSVAMIGFAPGFPYLLGLDPGLALPRHAQPRESVPAGSVGIAGAQTGIYPQPSPGGWQLIGRTPWRLFDPAREPPARLRPGQRLRFVPIELAQFERESEHPA